MHKLIRHRLFNKVMHKLIRHQLRNKLMHKLIRLRLCNNQFNIKLNMLILIRPLLLLNKLR